MEGIYLDHNATSPVREEVREAVQPFLGPRFGNPSSLHRWGRPVRVALDQARKEVAELLGAKPREICFTAGDDYAAFLIAHRAFRDKPGEIVLEDGSVLGAHAGLFRYTIGQRKGLGIAAPEPLYVVAKEMATNRLIVGPRKALACLGVTVREVVWTAGYVPSPGATLKVRIRYRSPSVAARLEASGERTFTVWFDEPVFGVAPGQAAVLYHDGEVLGGGWIAQSHRIKALSHSKGRVFIDTYGCRTNAADSSAIATELVSRGLHIAREADEAEVVVVNSCTVTHAATRDAGKGLRRARRARPDARFVLVGCLPAAQPGHRAENEADQVVSGNAPAAVADAVQRAMGLVPSVTRGQDVASPFGPPRTRVPLEATGNLSRINVKIQQGCDCRCAYCIVPDARGEPVSRPAKEIMAEVALAMEAGYPEVVVTGTNLAAYGRDQDDGTTLVRLMEMLEGLPQGRLRLSSLEPDSSLLPVLDRVARSRKWCRHLHLALQHGADPILTAMGRPCNFGVFRGLAKHAEGMIPGLALGMDVIVGFPGESEELFESSRRAIETLPFAYLHVFAWSPRPGTRAEALGERPSVVGTRERSRILRGLSDRRMAAFTASQVGTPAVLLVERRRDKREGKLIGLSDNYLRVLLEGPDNWMGKLVQCRLEQARSGVLLGGDARVVG